MGFFGSSKKKDNARTTPVEKSGLTVMKLRDNISVQEKREAHLMARIEKLETEAKEKNRRGDKRGALFALKKKKLHEQEIAKIENVKMTLETQAINLEGAVNNVETVNAMKKGTSAMKSIRKLMGIDKVDAVLDDVRDEMDMQREIDDALMQPIDPYLADEDDLMAELYALEAKDTLVSWPMAPKSKPNKKPTTTKPQHVQAQQPSKKSSSSMFAIFG